MCPRCTARFAARLDRCRTCALGLPAGIDRCGQCGQCGQAGAALDACHASVSANPWSTLVARFKIAREAGWAHAFAGLIAQDAGARQLLAAAHRVVPMPLSRERLAQRGCNRAHELAWRLGPGKVDPRIALRVRETASQADLDHDSRLANVRRAFALEPAHAASIRGQAVLLVDDVMTTGASLAALAQVLRDAGAASVSALMFTRTEDT
ncbi:MAG: ComF family protein [Ramlibacter sp.]